MLQAWVALPEDAEESEPAFDHYAQARLPEEHVADAWLRLVAGSAYGLTSPVQTHSPLFYVHAELHPNAKLALPAEHEERAAYVVRGRVEVDGHRYRRGQLLVFVPQTQPILQALEPTTVMLLGGAPLGPRHIWWNFVSSRKERIEQAKADWHAGRIALPVHDDEEFIPLPGGFEPPAEPLS